MTKVVFSAISTASLGAMLKGYGIIACLGEQDSDAEFWWDEAGKLVCRIVGQTLEEDSDPASKCLKMIDAGLRSWADLYKALRPAAIVWNDKKLRDRRTERDAQLRSIVDGLSEEAALAAASVSSDLILTHPLLPTFGKYGARPEANYLLAASKLPTDFTTLSTAVFGSRSQLKTTDLQGGGAYFPNGMRPVIAGYTRKMHQ